MSGLYKYNLHEPIGECNYICMTHELYIWLYYYFGYTYYYFYLR